MEQAKIRIPRTTRPPETTDSQTYPYQFPYYLDLKVKGADRTLKLQVLRDRINVTVWSTTPDGKSLTKKGTHQYTNALKLMAQLGPIDPASIIAARKMLGRTQLFPSHLQ